MAWNPEYRRAVPILDRDVASTLATAKKDRPPKRPKPKRCAYCGAAARDYDDPLFCARCGAARG